MENKIILAKGNIAASGAPDNIAINAGQLRNLFKNLSFGNWAITKISVHLAFTYTILDGEGGATSTYRIPRNNTWLYIQNINDQLPICGAWNGEECYIPLGNFNSLVINAYNTVPLGFTGSEGIAQGWFPITAVSILPIPVTIELTAINSNI